MIAGSILIVLAGLLSFALGFLFYRQLLHLGLVDKPNERSSHTEPTVRGGGLGIVFATLVSAGALLLVPSLNGGRLTGTDVFWKLVAPATVVAMVSFVDDVKS